jgi:hypothetical protein
MEAMFSPCSESLARPLVGELEAGGPGNMFRVNIHKKVLAGYKGQGIYVSSNKTVMYYTVLCVFMLLVICYHFDAFVRLFRLANYSNRAISVWWYIVRTLYRQENY